MLFMSGEVTFYKDEDFIDYMLGVRKHRGEQEAYGEMILYSFRGGPLTPLVTDYTDYREREILADFVLEECEGDPNPMLAFRCDTETVRSLGEHDDTYNSELNVIKNLVSEYSKRYGVSGFAVVHPAQKNDDPNVEASMLPPHIHVVYDDPQGDAPTLSEFVHSRI